MFYILLYLEVLNLFNWVSPIFLVVTSEEKSSSEWGSFLVTFPFTLQTYCTINKILHWSCVLGTLLMISLCHFSKRIFIERGVLSPADFLFKPTMPSTNSTEQLPPSGTPNGFFHSRGVSRRIFVQWLLGFHVTCTFLIQTYWANNSIIHKAKFCLSLGQSWRF